MRLGIVALGFVSSAVTMLYVACGGGNSSSAGDAGSIADAKSPTETGPSNPSDSGSGDGSAPTFPATVLTDSKIWSPVPARQSCDLFQANVVPDPFPTRVWRSCGSGAWATGCRVADAGLSIETFAGVATGQTSGTAIDGDIFIQASLQFSGTTVAQVFRLSDGATVAAARTDKPGGACLFVGSSRDDPFLIGPAYGAPDGGFTDLFGVAPSSPDAGIAWDQNWVSDPGNENDSFEFDNGHGYAFSGLGIESISTPTATTYTELNAAPGEIDTAARHDLLLWTLREAGGGEIRAYTTAHGVQSLVTTTDEVDAIFPLEVALSDAHMVWLTVARNASESYDSAQLFWSPVARQLSDLQTTTGPSLTNQQPEVGSLATGDDYAVVGSCDSNLTTPTCVLNVVQLSTKKVWVIPSRPGANAVIKVLAINSSELVFAESNGLHDNSVRRIVRVSTSQFQALSN